MVDDDDDMNVDACISSVLKKNLSVVGVGYNLRNKDIMESPRSRQFKQLNSLIVEVTVDSITDVDRRTCLDLWALKKLRFMQNDQLIIKRIRWMMMMMMIDDEV